MTDSSIKSPSQTFYRLQLTCSLFRFTLLNIPCYVGRFLYKLFLHFYTYKLILFAYKLKKNACTSVTAYIFGILTRVV